MRLVSVFGCVAIGTGRTLQQTGHLTQMRRRKCSNIRVFYWVYAHSYTRHSAKEVLDDDSSQIPVAAEDGMHVRSRPSPDPDSLIRGGPTLQEIVSLELTLPSRINGYEQAFNELPKYERDELKALLEHEISDNTRRNYLSQWRRFQKWAEGRNVESLPATKAQVAEYLRERMTEGHSPSTLRASVSAISHIHSVFGKDDPCRESVVRGTLSAATRVLGRIQKQAAPLTEEAFESIQRVACEPRIGRGGNLERLETALRRGSLDIAMVGMMRDGLLRISEAADVTWADIEWRSDGTGRLLIRRSKTDPEGRGFTVYLSMSTMSYLDTIRNGASDGDSVIGLRPNQIAKRIQCAAQQAGLGDGFSGHSCRVGMACDLAREGIGLPRIMNVGRWSSAQMVAHYTRSEAAGRNAVAEYYSYRLRLS